MRSIPLLSAREKMPFELTPIYLHLTYESAAEAQTAGDFPAEPQSSPAVALKK